MNTGYYRSGPQHMMHQNHHNPYGHQQQQQHPPSSSGSSGPGIVGPDAASMEKKRETRRRTKTGCLTCRKRRIKCDEGKPECMRCIKSKRVCEGYSVKTVFRNENQMHYQQNIRPTPNAPSPSTNGYSSNHQPIQFSVPQYQATNGDSGYNNHHTFATPQYGGPSSYPPSTQGNNKLTVEHASRNSSASNASGVSANSEQRRISVLSLMSSSEKFGSGPLASEPPAPKPSPPFQAPPRTAETDARDNYYYNYYVSCHAYTLARCIPTHNAPEPTSPDHPSILWPQIVPSLINNDPAGCRPLFDAAIAYTAHIRFEEIPIDFTIQSAGSQSRLIELGLKAYIDIIRGTSVTLSQVETFFTGDDYMRQIFRWGLLQHTIVQILADAKPRVPWVNYLGTKAFGSNAFQAHSDVETFYLGALRHISTGSLQIPQPLLDLHSHYDFLASPGMDVVYFAFVGDYDALRNLAYHITAHPRLEFLYLVWGMLNGARLKLGSGNEATRQQAHDLEMTANEVMMVLRQTS